MDITVRCLICWLVWRFLTNVSLSRCICLDIFRRQLLGKYTTFRKLALFPSSGETVQPNRLGPLEKANLIPRLFITVFNNCVPPAALYSVGWNWNMIMRVDFFRYFEGSIRGLLYVSRPLFAEHTVKIGYISYRIIDGRCSLFEVYLIYETFRVLARLPSSGDCHYTGSYCVLLVTEVVIEPWIFRIYQIYHGQWTLSSIVFLWWINQSAVATNL
jgi:hypothetical protein